MRHPSLFMSMKITDKKLNFRCSLLSSNLICICSSFSMYTVNDFLQKKNPTFYTYA